MSTATANGIIEIEVNGRQNGNLFFGPLSRRVRGRWEMGRAMDHDKGAGSLMRTWPEPIPGQRIGLDLDTGEGYIVEPLHDEAHATTRQRVLKSARLDPPRQSFNAVHKATWLYRLKRAVDGGYAKVTDGTFPEGIGPKTRQEYIGDEPKTDFFTPHRPTKDDKLTEAIREQTAMFGKLLDAIIADRKHK